MAYQTNPVFEYFGDSDRITCKAGADITGKTFVKLAPGGKDQVPVVVPCGAGDRPYGVAGWDVKKSLPGDLQNNDKVTVYRRGVVSVTAGAAITAGTGIVSGADGKAVATSTPGADFGLAHADAASGADVAVALSI